MRKSSIFKKLLTYMICATLLTALLTVAFYSFLGAGVFARRIADEMLPRAYGLSRLASRYQTGQITYDAFIDFSLREQRGTRIFIFDSYGNLIAYTTDRQPERNTELLRQFAYEVLESGSELAETNWRTSNQLGVVVGVPIIDNMERVSGAILMCKPMGELRQALRQLVLTLAMSCLAVSLIMIFPVYLISKRISVPIRDMTNVSTAMAGGDFSVRADETGNDEIGQLGSALNYLSARLDTNINDLKLARDRLHTILDGLHEGVVSMDGSFGMLYSNPAACALFDCADESGLPEKLTCMRETCAAVLRDREPRTMLVDAGERKLLLRASFSTESSEAAANTIIVIQDVTAAERLEQTRRDYVANVSHELRTPIASIRSLAETLDDGLITSEEGRSRYYGYILRESMRLSRLINDLLELSRLQSGAVALEKSAFPLNALLCEVVERMRIVASYSDISLTLVTGLSDTAEAVSNRDRIEQALVALIDNAIKFSSDDGRITIHEDTDADDPSRIWISVRNTGHIAENDLPHLFERFYKADTSHSDGGTGLGLAIVREVLTLLGERVEAYNEGGEVVFRFSVRMAGAGGE